MPELKHESLNATLTGVDLASCTQYRGIKYARISERFAEPSPLEPYQGDKIDCTQWGPKCPQIKVDVGHLLRTPKGELACDESEDEFECANLDVTVPGNRVTSGKLPALIWVHGGSQTISFGHGASKVGDVSKIVGESADCGKPIIVVSIQYRLNIFHVGDGEGTRNLGFKDQQIAVQWVRDHIAGFGGDPSNITLAGESAGACFAHGLLASGIKVRRAILMSGSMYLSPPRTEADARTLVIEPLSRQLGKKEVTSLREASVNDLIQAQADVGLASVFMQQDRYFDDWQKKSGEIEEVMIGDCEFESILWRNGIEGMTAEQISSCFDKAGKSSSQLKELYHIDQARPTQSKHGALDLLNDMAFGLPTQVLARTFGDAGKTVYRYLFDQTNPWQSSSRAHHAVDLLYLFGGFDMRANPSAEALGKEMRRRFILFINGDCPWSPDRAFAFGPFGGCSEIEDADVAARRRTRQIERLQEMDSSDIKAAYGSLAAGRISLHN